MEYNSKKCNFDGGDCCPVLGSDFRDGMFYGGKLETFILCFAMMVFPTHVYMCLLICRWNM